MDFGLTGKRAWISGGEGGIGRAAAELLIEEGARVIVTDKQAPSWACDSSILTLPCDVTRLEDINNVVQGIEQRYGGVDILVNCAGIMRRSDVLLLEPGLWDGVMDVNLKASFFTGQAVAKSMVRNKTPGSIVNLSSINSEVVFPETVAYSTSKGGVRTLTMAMAVALGPHGIRVNAVAPGAIPDTNLERERWNLADARSAIESRTPLSRLGKSRDIAPLIAYLASDVASFVTGSIFFIDGGRMVVA